MKEVQIKGMENGKLTVALSGEIDSGKAEEFFAAVSSAYRETPASLSFECAEDPKACQNGRQRHEPPRLTA